MNRLQWKEWWRQERLSKKEVWKDVPGYESIYQVSNFGRVKSIERNVKFIRNTKYIKERILKQSISGGYARVTLSKLGLHNTVDVHRIVSIVFIENPENKPCVNHKNGIRNYNRVENLEWCTSQENNIHAFRVLGRKSTPPPKGELSKRAKKIKQYSLDGKFIREWIGIKECARQLGINQSQISHCISGKRKQGGGYIWTL